MTTPKTSFKKLRTRNEKVKDLKSALLASRWKWKEAQGQAINLWNLIDHTCGFCILAMNTRESGQTKCDKCPTEIREECNRIQKKTSEIWVQMDQVIIETRVFLDGLKY